MFAHYESFFVPLFISQTLLFGGGGGGGGVAIFFAFPFS